ncbi:MAG TPA: TasA family protein [Candidatus Woesebacteria bacterium]|nr:TasA family protein [Candidatus Woesebacteria bacterium]
MKKIFLSLAIIVVVSGFCISLTKAYFSDKKTSNGNKFIVGTLNLEVGDSQNKQVEPFVISDLGSSKITGQKLWKLKNVGTLPGKLTIDLGNIINNENGCNTPESEVDQTCGNPGINEGELGNVISANFYVNNVSKVTANLNQSGSESLINYWNNEANSFVLDPNQEIELKMEWFESDIYGNEIQSDSLAFDINFSLQQISN